MDVPNRPCQAVGETQSGSITSFSDSKSSFFPRLQIEEYVQLEKTGKCDVHSCKYKNDSHATYKPESRWWVSTLIAAESCAVPGRMQLWKQNALPAPTPRGLGVCGNSALIASLFLVE